MEQKDFEDNIKGAALFAKLSQDTAEADFWVGYALGIRRHYHGESFGTQKGHTRRMEQLNSQYVRRRALGRGYCIGFEGKPFIEAMKPAVFSVYDTDKDDPTSKGD